MAPPAFVHRRPIRFSHCDPGGIVYFPHYFEMVYEAGEDWFDATLEPNLETRLREQGSGFPTINTKCDFSRPSRVGDVMAFEISVARLGRSTVEFLVLGKVGDEERLRVQHLLALVSLDSLRAAPIPDAMRATLASHVAGPEAATVPADPLKTPESIRPEWYLLAPYQMLKLIPNKFLGISLLIILMGVFIFWPFLDKQKEKNILKRPVLRGVFILLIIAWIILMWWGRR